MAILFACPRCDILQSAKDNLAGQESLCSHCGKIIAVPRGKQTNAAMVAFKISLACIAIVAICYVGMVALRFAQMRLTRTFPPSRVRAAMLELSSLAQSVEQYYVDTGTYPPTLDGLVVAPDDLTDPSKWHGPYLKKPQLPKDPWGNHYEYQVHQNVVYLRSAGGDGQFDTEDDINYP